MQIYFIYVGLRFYQSLANRYVLLHASKSKRTFASDRDGSGVSSKVKQHLYYLRMIVNTCLHQTGKTEVVLDIYVKDGIFVYFTKTVPVCKQQLRAFAEAICANYMQSIAPVGILEINIDSFLQQQLHYVELVSARCYQKRIA